MFCDLFSLKEYENHSRILTKLRDIEIGAKNENFFSFFTATLLWTNKVQYKLYFSKIEKKVKKLT